MKVQLNLPPKLIPVFTRQDVRYRGAYGGRGSAKTRTFAKMTAVVAYQRAMQGESGVILCGREFMNSLEDSSLEEIKQAIQSEPWLADFFDVGEKYVRTKCGRISYIFTGLRHNLDSIKSKARILLAWIDEAESVSEMAWRKLLPTVRESGSEIWLTWNPEKKGSATDLRFRQHQDESMAIVEMNYSDNPWFPDVLEQERLRDKARLDDATYRWIWEGDYLEESEAQVFRGKYQELEFKPLPDFEGPYHGLDFGFAHDPTAAIKCWVFKDKLYIEYEAGKVGLELDDTATFLQKGIAGIEQYVIRADSARPESISYLKRHGLSRIDGVPKWKGSVEDGIAHIKSYKKIYIHPRCQQTLNEFRLYSYKTDRLSGDVLPTLVDAHNHYIDALRYALNPRIQRKLKKFDGIDDVAKAKEALKTVENLDAKKLIDAGEAEKVKQEVIKGYEQKLADAKALAEKVQGQLHTELIGGSFARSKFVTEKLAMPVDVAQAFFGKHFSIDENGAILAKDAFGNEIFSRVKPGQRADFEEALEALVDAYPNKNSILKGTGSSGGGGGAGGSPATKPKSLSECKTDEERIAYMQSVA